MLMKLFCSNEHFESEPFFPHPTLCGDFTFFPSHLPSPYFFFAFPPRRGAPLLLSRNEHLPRSFTMKPNPPGMRIKQEPGSSVGASQVQSPSPCWHYAAASQDACRSVDPPLGLMQADEPPVLDRIGAAHGHMEGDVAVTPRVMVSLITFLKILITNQIH
jgi:hypothetical protein